MRPRITMIGFVLHDDGDCEMFIKTRRGSDFLLADGGWSAWNENGQCGGWPGERTVAETKKIIEEVLATIPPQRSDP